MATYRIGPSIGVARVGNSKSSFYIAPDSIGGRPCECDANGDRTSAPVEHYKDELGRIRRQAALFTVFEIDDASGEAREVLLDDPSLGLASISWTVHLANKKAVWYNFQELEGNLLLGPHNSYADKRVPLRNETATGAQRTALIIDPGPRTISGSRQSAEFSRDTIPPGYPGSFPDPHPDQGLPITTLGEMRTDSRGRLLVLGGFGNACGSASITSFAGADGWHDDVSDGSVVCEMRFLDSAKPLVRLEAWCIVGSPKFAPELVNIVSLDDLVFDVAVREKNLLPQMFSSGRYNPDYVVNFERDIEPILKRPGEYRWVANVPSLNSFSPPPFDPRDRSEKTAELRKAYFHLFREPGSNGFTDGQQQQLLDDASGIPMMPLNSGSNSVRTDDSMSKFLTLTRTQHFMLGQWAQGRFSDEPPAPLPGVLAQDRASTGNCVGGPLCPGIEVTWSLYSPEIYAAPYQIRHAPLLPDQPLATDRNETATNEGCQPGDLTKRMAIPWQADFFQCTVQYVNFTDPHVNKADGVPKPPTYYAYWWPPQSPWNVLPGPMNPLDQAAAGVPAALPSIYSRGINSFGEMIQAWHYLGFITNEAKGKFRDTFPYFVETERNHKGFVAASVAVAGANNVLTGADANFSNTWYLAPVPETSPSGHIGLMGAAGAGADPTLAAAERPRIDPRQLFFSRGRFVR